MEGDDDDNDYNDDQPLAANLTQFSDQQSWEKKAKHFLQRNISDGVCLWSRIWIGI